MKGDVRIDWELARLDRPGFERPQKWDDMVKEDLDRLETPDPPKFTHALAGVGISGGRPMVSANTTYNKAKALFGRVYRQQPGADWGKGPAPEIWTWARQFVDHLLPGLFAEKMPVEEWLDSMPSRRRTALRLAYLKYSRAGWKEGYKKFVAFVKTELLPGFAKRGGDLDRLLDMMDRIIQGPCDETHVIAGPWLKPLVKKLKEIWTSDGPIFYGSASPESLHKWLQRLLDRPGVQASGVEGQTDPTFFWSDFTMFDNTHSRDSWAFMRYLYRRAGIDDPDFWRVLDAWEKPAGRIGAMCYQARTMNASGRDDTSLANGVLNGVATYLSACAALLGVPLCSITIDDVRKCLPQIVLSVSGDDSLGRVPNMTLEQRLGFRERMIENLRMFGFTAKLFCSTRVEDAVYLGMRPYPTRSGWFWGKTIGRSTYKMGWVVDRGSRDVMAHITGIADMHKLCSSHVPVLSDLADTILRLRDGAKRSPPILDPNKPWEWTFKSGVGYDDLTLASVARAYSTVPTRDGSHEVDQEVTVADIKDLVDTIRGIERLPCVVDHWVWRRMVLVDDL